MAEEMGLPVIDVELDVDPQSSWWDDEAVHNSDLSGHPCCSPTAELAHLDVTLPNVAIEGFRGTEPGPNDMTEGSR